MNFVAKKLEPNLWKDFESFFEFGGKVSGCWCMNHRLPIGLNFEGDAAKLAMKQLVEKKRVYGILACVEGDPTPVGWCSLDQRRTLPGHDCIAGDVQCDENIWSIHCITCRSDFKNHGVEEFLSAEALKLAQDLKAQVVEAYPEPGSRVGESFKTWNTFNGYQSYFEFLGFTKVEKDFGECSEFFSPMKKDLSVSMKKEI